MIYMGYSAYNIELYVAKVDYEKAKELLNDLNIDTNKKVDQEITKEDENKNKSVSFYLAQIIMFLSPSKRFPKVFCSNLNYAH
jgi:hypothetical protein